MATRMLLPIRLSSRSSDKSRCAHVPVDIAGGLVGDDDFGRHDDGAGKGRPLALAARKFRRQRVGAVGDPVQASSSAMLSASPSGHDRRAMSGRAMFSEIGRVVEELAILVDDPDAAAGLGDAVAFRAPRRRCRRPRPAPVVG